MAPKWEVSIVSSIQKLRLLIRFENCRPTHNLQPLSFAVDYLLCMFLVNKLTTGLNSAQQDFVAEKSLVTQFIADIEELIAAVVKGIFTAEAYIDFVRAFDSVPRSRFFTQLSKCCLIQDFVELLSFYLCDRFQCVRVRLQFSTTITILRSFSLQSCRSPSSRLANWWLIKLHWLPSLSTRWRYQNCYSKNTIKLIKKLPYFRSDHQKVVRQDIRLQVDFLFLVGRQITLCLFFMKLFKLSKMLM